MLERWKASTAKILHLPDVEHLPVLAEATAPSLAQPSTDPVLAALQAHRAAHAVHETAIDEAGKYETFPVTSWRVEG